MLLVGLTTVEALAASPEVADGRDDITRESEMSLFEFLGAMVEDDEGWVGPLDFDVPAAGGLDTDPVDAAEDREIRIVEEQP